MNESDIRNAFAPYKHPYWGVVGVYPSNFENKDAFTCDNYHMFNALYWAILKSNGCFPLLSEISTTCSFVAVCEKIEGLYARFPTRMNDDISQDEIYGICNVSPADGIAVAEYGTNWKTLYCYWLANPNHWRWGYCFGRYPSFIAYVKAAAGKPIWFSQFFWCLGFLASSLTSHSETSGKLLSYLQIPIMENHFLPRIVIRMWRFIMTKRYPGGLKEVMGIYFAAQPDSPFIKCARGDWK